MDECQKIACQADQVNSYMSQSPTDGQNIKESRNYLAEVQVAYAQLEAKFQKQDEYFCFIAHELKTFMTSLSLNLQFMKCLVESSQKEDRTQVLSKRMNISILQLRHFSEVVNDLYSVSEIAGSQLKFQIIDFDLSSRVLQVVESFQEELRQAKCLVQLDLVESLRVRWDPNRTDQILTNLLSNAIKYGRGAPIHISVQQNQEAGTVQVIVRDHGMGIAPEDCSKIFERFVRLNNEKSQIKGLGLGLYISQQIANSLGGVIRVESVPNLGSAFILEITQKKD